jgi:hypothetical protein
VAGIRPFILLAGAVCAFAQGPWKIGGRVGMRQEGSLLVPTAAITAEYQVMDRLTWRTDFEAQFKDLTNMDDFALHVPTHLLWHPLGTQAVFDPYAGPGASFGLDFDRNAMLGLNAVVGFTVRPRQQQAFGLEGRWSHPDLTRTTKGRWDVALTGNWEVRF